MSVLTEKFSQVKFTIKKHSRVSPHLESESSKYVQTQRVKDIDKHWQASCKLNITRGLGRLLRQRPAQGILFSGPEQWTDCCLRTTPSNLDLGFHRQGEVSLHRRLFCGGELLFWGRVMFREILEPIYQELLLTSTLQDRYVIIIRIYIMHAVIFL